MNEWVKWKTKRNDLGHIDHFLYDTIDYKMVGHVRKTGRIFEAKVLGRPLFTRRTLKSAKSDVEMIFDKLGVGQDFSGDVNFEEA